MLQRSRGPHDALLTSDTWQLHSWPAASSFPPSTSPAAKQATAPRTHLDDQGRHNGLGVDQAGDAQVLDAAVAEDLSARLATRMETQGW